jgi:hypothetical protein
VGEKGFDFCLSHLCGVAFIVKEDVALDPRDVGLLCSDGIMLYPNGVANTLQQSCGLFPHLSLSFVKMAM